MLSLPPIWLKSEGDNYPARGGCGQDVDDRIDEPDAMPPSAEPYGEVPREGNLHDPETDPAPGESR